jgi:exonuclease VII large subunit
MGRVRLATRDFERAAANAERALALALRRRSQQVVALDRRLDRFDPSRRLAERGQALEVNRYRLERAAREQVARARDRLERSRDRLEPAALAGHHGRVLRVQFAQTRLDGNNPEKILQQGYAIVRYDGAVVRDPQAVPEGAQIRAQVAHGTLVARVEVREADGAE